MKELGNLQEELELHRKSLRDVSDSLKRLSGRVKANGDEENVVSFSSSSSSNKRDQHHRHNDSNRGPRLSSSSSHSNRHGDTRIADESTQRVLKRKMVDDDPLRYNPKHLMLDRGGGVRGGGGGRRGGGYDDDLDPRQSTSAIRSSVISKNIKTRQDLIRLQTKFNGSEQRNRRMIGLLVGTLREFKSDDTERSQTKQALDRKELEKKIEEKKAEEREKMKEERKKLERERYKSIRNIKILEKKIELTQSFEEWKKTQTRLRHFIRTETQPTIFYLPRTHCPNSQELLESNARLIDQQIETRQRELDRELEALTQESAALMASEDMIVDDENEEVDEVWEEAGTTSETPAAADKDGATKVGDELDKEPDDVQLVETSEEIIDAPESATIADNPPPPPPPPQQPLTSTGDEK